MRAPARLGSVLASLAIVLPAQQVVTAATADRGAIVATKDGLTLPAGQLSVPDVIDAVAAFLCRNYLYDFDVANNARGFTLQRPVAVDALGAEELLHSLLSSRDLAALPIDEARGVWTVVSLLPGQCAAAITNVPWRTPDEVLRRPRLRQLVMTVVELQHADAQQVANALQMQFSLRGTWQPGMPAASAPNPHMLLLHGFGDQLAPLIVMVRQLDKLLAPSPPSDAVLERLLRLELEVAELRAALAQKQR